MAVELIGQSQRWQGLSSDTKPTDGVRLGAEFYEIDTKKKLTYTAPGWVEAAESTVLKGSNFNYTQLPYLVVAISGNLLYAQDLATNYIHSSADGGNTWSGSLAQNVPTVRTGVVTAAGNVVLVCQNGDVYLSTDAGATFARTLDEGKDILVAGIDVNGETVIFAQYGVDLPDTFKVYKSADGGATWAAIAAMTKDTTAIRHYHTVKYIRELATWIITSGDATAETFWWKSVDDGGTWAQVATGSPPYRNVGLAVIPQKTAVWGHDSSPDTVIYAANLDDITNYRKIGHLPGHCMGLGGSKNILIASVRIEEADPKGSELSWVYVSPDGGATWVQEGVLSGSYYGLLGPDAEHRFYLQSQTGVGAYITTRAVPRKNVSALLHPLSASRSWHPVEISLLSKGFADFNDTNPKWAAALTETVFDPVLVIKSSLDQAIKIRLNSSNEWYADEASVFYGQPVTAGKDALLNGSTWKALGGPLPKGLILGVAADAAAASGTLTLTLYGRVSRYDDHRHLS